MNNGGPAFPRVLSLERRYNPPCSGDSNLHCRSCGTDIPIGAEHYVANVQIEEYSKSCAYVVVCMRCGAQHNKARKRVIPKELDARALLAESDKRNEAQESDDGK